MAVLEEAVGAIIRRAREQSRITQRELGYLTQLDPVTISRIERGVRLPSLASVLLIAKALKTPASEMIAEIETAATDLVSVEDPATTYRKKGNRSGD